MTDIRQGSRWRMSKEESDSDGSLALQESKPELKRPPLFKVVLINDDYTIVDELGQDILEKDYEDELSATQLLNAEIDKAAAELAESIGDSDATVEAAAAGESDDGGRLVGSNDDTSIEMQLTNLSELELTATLEAQNDEMEDDLDVTANIKADDKTLEMPRDKDGARAR